MDRCYALTAPTEAAGLDITAWVAQEKQFAGPVPVQEQAVTLTIGSATKLSYASGAGGTLIEQYYLRFNGRNIRIVVSNNYNNPLVSGVLNSLRSA